MNRKKLLTRSVLAAATVGVLAAVVALVGSSSSQAATDGDLGPHAAATVPVAVAVPAGQKLTSVFSAQGVQVYQCTAGAWTFVEPAAGLIGRTVAARSSYQTAVHFRGPSWESTTDGSLVTATAVASAPVPGSIPLLLLKAAANRGDGTFGKVSYIQRLETSGGAVPAGTCTDGATKGVPYQARYKFYSPAS